MKLALGLVVMLTGCFTVNSGGAYPGPAYRDTDLGGGEYMVVVSGGTHTRAREIALGRAAEVCGSGGFDVLEADANSNEAYQASSTVVSTTVTDVSTYDITMIYQCRAGSGRLVQRTYASSPADNSAANLPRY